MSGQGPSAPLKSSQDFVRALKAASDPPVAGGLSKFEIAEAAWNNANFYVPSKAELIADWLFTKLLKERGKELPLNPIFDTRYWQLIAKLINSQNSASSAVDSRSTKSWLTTLLHRIPLGPVIVSFLISFKDVQAEEQDVLALSVSTCLSVLWSLLVQRMSTELLLECFGAFICSALASRPNGGIASIGNMISSSYRNSLTNSSNKKKLYQSFLQSHLKNWLQLLSGDYCSHDASLKIAIFDTGVETLFNLDILRQNHDSKTENYLMECLQLLAATEKTLVFNHISSLLVSYIQAVKKHRGALFSQGSHPQPGAFMDEPREAGMQFCLSLLGLVQDSERDSPAWTTRASLLEIVEKENLFDRRQVDVQMTFIRILEHILLSLQEGWKESQLRCTELAVQCLSTISRIDYDLILPCVPRILPLLLQIPTASNSCFAFLEILLSYHTKTRTMATLIQSLFTSIFVRRTCSGSSPEVYQICFSSPIMHTLHLERLAKALQTFLTESQCLPTMRIVFDSVKGTWEQIYNAAHQRGEGEGSRKKRKTSSAFVNSKIDLDDLAVNYALAARLASVFLPSLPLAFLSTSKQEEVRQLLGGFRTEFIHHALSKSVKLLKKDRDGDMWSMGIATAASLRLVYALNVSRNLCLPLSHDTKLAGKMLEIVNDDGLLPELTVELYRILLYGLSHNNGSSSQDIIGRLLDHLEKHFTAPDITWSGNSHHLIKSELGQAESALALMHMIVERWIPEIDRLASSEQLERFLKIIMSIKFPVCQSREGIRSEQLLLEILHSAQFFEFPNVRNVFLGLLDKMTAPLDPSAVKLPKTSTTLEKVAVYQHLLFFPMEYFSWQLLNDLIVRALTTDVALSRPSSSRKQGVAEGRIVLRVFLKRAYVYCGSIGQDSNKDTSEFLISLLKDSAAVDTVIEADFTKATIDLVEVYFSKLLKASKKTGPESILQVLATFPPDLFAGSHEIASNSFIAFVSLLVKEFPRSSLSEGIIEAIQKLYSGVFASLLPQMTLEQGNVTEYYSLVSGWYSLLCLQKWLDITTDDSSTPFIGQKLTARLIQIKTQERNGPVSHGKANDSLCVIVFAILLQELEALPVSEHYLHLDMVVAGYIAFADHLNVTNIEQMDHYLGRTYKNLALEDYVHLLTTVSESLSDIEHIPSHQSLHLVHLAALLLHEHPSHSLAHVQKFATRCINTFTDHPIFIDGPVALRLQALHTVTQYCISQPAALRSVDTAGICLLLSKFLAPAPAHTHDACTDPRVFHAITGVLSILVRLRRDLLAAHALPHLGLLLREMLRCMRAPRPGLGARQMALVLDTQPRWIGAAGPALGAEEARVFARLLESLAAKTTARTFAQVQEAQGTNVKAEALAKPFAKHATYVLQAHVVAANEPLCVLPRAVRRELQPGLYALCGMVSEHGRDALMVSALDAGGRATLKALWKEYEEQRYVGRG